MVRSAYESVAAIGIVCLAFVAPQRTALNDDARARMLPTPELSWPIEAMLPDDPILAAALRNFAPDEPTHADEAAPAAPPEPTLSPTPDMSTIKAAAAAYGRGDLAVGDAISQGADDPVQALALEWIALKSTTPPDYDRLAAFGVAHPRWPANDWVRYQQEAALYARPFSDRAIGELFGSEQPQSPPGKLALARLARDAGHLDQAAATVRALWRNETLNLWTEGVLLRDFASLLTSADHKFRADRLLYAENAAAALRAAALAGPDVLALATARAASLRGPLAQPLVDRLPIALRSDPGLLYQRIRAARRADHTIEAAALLAGAPRDPAALIDGDRWWGEQRLVARRLLDMGQAAQAYALCERNAAVSEAARTDAEFLAGWIALRFLNRPEDAGRHFALAAVHAKAPWSVARAAYWRGRAAEALKRDDEARDDYARGAAFPVVYYGQLSAQKLGRAAATLRAPQSVATGDARDEAIRVVETLYAAGLDAFARSLALDIARTASDDSQIAALGAIVNARGDAYASVAVGKKAIERGFWLDEIAFPTYGVPVFSPVGKSADLPLIYAVARQESEFAPAAASGAGAKGLMQVMPATARETAVKVGLPFDADRLISDPAFNTQIGAAYLGQLLNDESGSPMLAFAAYNAGSGRVKQWINAYGDPRVSADPVDWVERIPFDETRDYVQKVSENLGVYRARLADATPNLARVGGP